MKYITILISLLMIGCGDYEFREQMIKNKVKDWAVTMNYQIDNNIVCEYQRIGGFNPQDYWLCNVKIENDIINLKCTERQKCIKV